MHVSCGPCHNRSTDANGVKSSVYLLTRASSLLAPDGGAATVASLDAYTSTVGKTTMIEIPDGGGATFSIIKAGDPSASLTSYLSGRRVGSEREPEREGADAADRHSPRRRQGACARSTPGSARFRRRSPEKQGRRDLARSIRFCLTIPPGANAYSLLRWCRARGGDCSRDDRDGPATREAAGEADEAARPPRRTRRHEEPSAIGDGGANGPVEAPPVAETADGSVKPSPLNPTPQELPSNAVDAGTPLDYDRLLADIAALRARVAAVSDNLYQSRVAVALQTDGDHGKIARLTVSLDDGVIYTAPASFAASDMTVVYDHAVAPGRHAVTVDIDRKDDRDETFRTSQKNRFTVDVPRDHRVEVQVKVIDDSSMGKDFPADKNGRYDLRVRVKAVAKPVTK